MKFKPFMERTARFLTSAARQLWHWLGVAAKFAVRMFIRLFKLLRSWAAWLLRMLRRWVVGEKPSASPLGMILHDPKANIDLHLFLLGNPDKNQPTPITVDGRTFEVGIVSINPAPVLNTLQRTTTG